MKLILQILFLLLSWFVNLVSATPVFTKVVLPSYKLSFSNTENEKEESIIKIGIQNFARSGIENQFSSISKGEVWASIACSEKPKALLQGAGNLWKSPLSLVCF